MIAPRLPSDESTLFSTGAYWAFQGADEKEDCRTELGTNAVVQSAPTQ